MSGIVRDEFRAKGHDAWSCDILPSERPSPYHIQGDIFKAIDSQEWDMLIVFPPCTYLCVSGARWFADPERQKKQEAALEFVRKLMNCGISKIALENPVGIISTRIMKPTQIVQPWQFGEDASKTTCLWLFNLPKLVPTNILTPYRWDSKGHPRWANQSPSGSNKLGPSLTRSIERSRTFVGIAKAMAEQWG